MGQDETRAGARTRHQRLIPLALAGLALILAAVVWTLALPVPPLQVARLPDGAVLRLEAVTIGPQHKMVRGRYWQRLLGSYWPGPLASFAPMVFTCRPP